MTGEYDTVFDDEDKRLGTVRRHSITSDGGVVHYLVADDESLTYYLWDELRGSRPTMDVLVNEYGLGPELDQEQWTDVKIDFVTDDASAIGGTLRLAQTVWTQCCPLVERHGVWSWIAYLDHSLRPATSIVMAFSTRRTLTV